MTTDRAQDLWGYKEGEGWHIEVSYGDHCCEPMALVVPFLHKFGFPTKYPYNSGCCFYTVDVIVNHLLDCIEGHHDYRLATLGVPSYDT